MRGCRAPNLRQTFWTPRVLASWRPSPGARAVTCASRTGGIYASCVSWCWGQDEWMHERAYVTIRRGRHELSQCTLHVCVVCMGVYVCVCIHIHTHASSYLLYCVWPRAKSSWTWNSMCEYLLCMCVWLECKCRRLVTYSVWRRRTKLYGFDHYICVCLACVCVRVCKSYLPCAKSEAPSALNDTSHRHRRPPQVHACSRPLPRLACRGPADNISVHNTYTLHMHI